MPTIARRDPMTDTAGADGDLVSPTKLNSDKADTLIGFLG